jgi:hypothetical protein
MKNDKPINTTDDEVQTDDETLLWLMEGAHESEDDYSDAPDAGDRGDWLLEKGDLEVRDSLRSLWADYEVECTHALRAWYDLPGSSALVADTYGTAEDFADGAANGSGFYDIYMTLTGSGVGIDDGRWDELFVDGCPDSLVTHLETTLGDFASDAGCGSLVEEFARCCYPVECDVFTDNAMTCDTHTARELGAVCSWETLAGLPADARVYVEKKGGHTRLIEAWGRTRYLGTLTSGQLAALQAPTLFTNVEMRSWALAADDGEYLAEFSDTPLPAGCVDDGSRCGYSDEQLAEVSRLLTRRNMRLVTDSRGILAVQS